MGCRAARKTILEGSAGTRFFDWTCYLAVFMAKTVLRPEQVCRLHTRGMRCKLQVPSCMLHSAIHGTLHLFARAAGWPCAGLLDATMLA